MAYAKLSPVQIQSLKAIRSFDDTLRSELRGSLFATIKAELGIPAEHKIKVEVDDTTVPLYGVIVRKKDGQPYPLDHATGKITTTTVPTQQVPEQRWFHIDKEAIIAAVETMGHDFDEGNLGHPRGDRVGDVVVDEDGDVYVLLTAGDIL